MNTNGQRDAPLVRAAALERGEIGLLKKGVAVEELTVSETGASRPEACTER